MTTSAPAVPITFTSVLEVLGERMVVRLPAAASQRLPSRGQVAAHALLGDEERDLVVEPDGLRGHWISVPEDLRERLGEAGEELELSLTPTKDWPEPEIPSDLRAALDDAAHLAEVWAGLTPMARWEWVRWVKATKNPATRARRVEVTISKLENGKRRPCCFDLSSCTDPELSKSGKLISS